MDVKLRQHHVNSAARPLPKIPGCDFCGIILDTTQCPDPRVSVGDIVFGMTKILHSPFGSMSEIITVEEEYVAAAPHAQYYDDASLAALPLVGLTVIQAFLPWISRYAGVSSIYLGLYLYANAVSVL